MALLIFAPTRSWAHLGCAVEVPPVEEVLQKEEAFQRSAQRNQNRDAFSIFNFVEWFLCSFLKIYCDRPDTIVIPTYIHVIYKEDGTGSNVTPEKLNELVAKMNTDMAQAKIILDVMDYTFTTNDDWYEGGLASVFTRSMFQTLRQGTGFDALNIYVKNVRVGQGLACGQATLAQDVGAWRERDGILVAGGEYFDSCNIEGNAVAHEIGKQPPRRHCSELGVH